MYQYLKMERVNHEVSTETQIWMGNWEIIDFQLMKRLLRSAIKEEVKAGNRKQERNQLAEE